MHDTHAIDATASIGSGGASGGAEVMSVRSAGVPVDWPIRTKAASPAATRTVHADRSSLRRRSVVMVCPSE